MIICSALYYPGSLNNLNSLVRDNRFYPAKASQTFAVWWAYVRKHYPDIHVILFCDAHSPIPIQSILDAHLHEPYDVGNPECSRAFSTDADSPLVHVRWLHEHSGKYFWPMQRNLVEAILHAYFAGPLDMGPGWAGPGEDLFWLDADAFLNTDIRPLVAGYDAAAPELAHHQMTMDSVCTYISAARLHALDSLGVDLPAFLTDMLAHGPTDTRMHTLQEGGLYKLFAYGRTRALGGSIELAHLSCYDHFMTFLRRNPLDTPEYRSLVARLEAIDISRLAGVEMRFHDMLYSAGGGA